MNGRIPMLAAAMLAATAVLAVAAGAAGASPVVIYNNIAAPLPGNLPSQSFQATRTSELGGLVKFGGAARKNPIVTIGMSSFECEKGGWNGSPELCQTVPGAKVATPVPVTLNIYKVGSPNTEVGAKIVTLTQEFMMPYRPSASAKCAAKGEPTKWYHMGKCFNAKLFKITFSKLGTKKAPVTLPDEAIISVAYNTESAGYEPKGVGGAYNNLNVATSAEAPAPVGAEDPLPNYAFITNQFASEYCGSGVTPGSFGLSGSEANPCWEGAQPAISVKATE